MSDAKEYKQVPIRFATHFLWVTFFFGAAGSSLWQHGDPMFSLILLGSIYPLGLLAYLPERWWNDWPKVMLQVTAAFGACAWGAYRVSNGVPPDRVLAESISLLGFCFVFARGRSDYHYLLLISIILLLYGSLIPRAMYLLFGGISLLLLPLLLYATRAQALFGRAILKRPKRFIRRNWGHIMVHFTIFIIFTYYFFMLLPNRYEKREGSGLIVVSFKNENNNLAPNFNRWIKKKPVKTSTSGTQVKSGVKKPTLVSKKGPKIALKKGPSMSSDGQGGSGLPGKEMVFRVKSPVKLYWLAQLYDDYDGVKWYASDRLEKRARNSAYREQNLHYLSGNIEQEFFIEKWVSKRLYSAFRKISLTPVKRSQMLMVKNNFYGADVTLSSKGEFPQLPFAYVVSSKLYQPHDVTKSTPRVNARKRRVKLTYHTENINLRHYLNLPRKKISKRLRKLAKDITKDIDDPYEKAMALRNYLRNNYGYKMRSRPLPAGRESADFFIFELKEGHCEYFAAALTVLARLNRLPARVATGFSPGNYNVITGLFEVHEYHAHAWTQIFIEGKGWLTFDAAPPGAVESRTTPLAFSSLRDPFGETWKVQPPELSDKTQEVVREQIIKKLERLGGERDTSKTDQLLLKTVEMQDRLKEKINDFFKEKEVEPGAKKKRSMYEELKYRLQQIYLKLKGGLKDMARLLKSYWPVILIVFMLLIALKVAYDMISYYIFRKIVIRRCRDKLNQARQIVEQAPDKAVLLAYQSSRAMLVLSDLPRIRNLELHEYCAVLKNVDFELSRSMLVICFFFSKLEYSTESIPIDEAKITLDHALLVRDKISRRINEDI